MNPTFRRLRLTPRYAFQIWHAEPVDRTFGNVHFTRYKDWFETGPPAFSLPLDVRTPVEIQEDRHSFLYSHSYIELCDPEGSGEIPPLWSELTGGMYVEMSDNPPWNNKLLISAQIYFDCEADAVEVSLFMKRILTNHRFTPQSLAVLLAHGSVDQFAI